MASSPTHTSARSYGRGGYMIAFIRALFKESWQRDLLLVKGDITDNCVIGEVDVQALRQFQSSHRSPFKPVPDQFEIDFGRRVLSAREKE